MSNIIHKNIKTPNKSLRRRDAKKNNNSFIYTIHYAVEMYNNLTDYLTYTEDSIEGDFFTIIKPGIYSITASLIDSSSGNSFSIVRNFNIDLNDFNSTDKVYLINSPNKVLVSKNHNLSNGSGWADTIHWTGHLDSGDVVRIYMESNSVYSTGNETGYVTFLDVVLIHEN